MMTPETWSLVEALLARPDLAEAGRKALARAFPQAPPAMVSAGAFHLFTGGCTAAVNWLASLEQFLRKPESGLDFGATWDVLYHLYNWQLVEALLPWCPATLEQQLADAKQLHAGESEPARELHECQRIAEPALLTLADRVGIRLQAEESP